jgi:hypothetical protein
MRRILLPAVAAAVVAILVAPAALANWRTKLDFFWIRTSARDALVTA